MVDQPKFGVKFLPILISFIVITASLMTCSTFGQMLSLILFFFSSFFYSQKHFVRELKQGLSKWTTFRHVYVTLFFLLLVAFIPTVPMGIVWFNDYFINPNWAKNFADIFIFSSNSIAISISILFQPSNEMTEKRLLNMITVIETGKFNF
jgi:hypothetical protein